jgi:hypothetical protein
MYPSRLWAEAAEDSPCYSWYKDDIGAAENVTCWGPLQNLYFKVDLANEFMWAVVKLGNTLLHVHLLHKITHFFICAYSNQCIIINYVWQIIKTRIDLKEKIQLHVRPATQSGVRTAWIHQNQAGPQTSEGTSRSYLGRKPQRSSAASILPSRPKEGRRTLPPLPTSMKKYWITHTPRILKNNVPTSRNIKNLQGQSNMSSSSGGENEVCPVLSDSLEDLLSWPNSLHVLLGIPVKGQ